MYYAIINSKNNQVNDTDLMSEEDLLLLRSENEEQIPEEMLNQFQKFQFKQFVKKAYKNGKYYRWRNEDISSALLNGLNIADNPENRKILDNIGLIDNN